MKIQEYFKDIDKSIYSYYRIKKEYYSRDGLEYDEFYQVNERTLSLLNEEEIVDVVRSDRDGYLIFIKRVIPDGDGSRLLSGLTE